MYTVHGGVVSVTCNMAVDASRIMNYALFVVLCTAHVTRLKSHRIPHISSSHVTRHTSHVTRHTSHIMHRTSHVTSHTSHFTHHTSHVTRHTSHVTRHTSHIMHRTSHITRHTSHVTHHTSHLTGVGFVVVRFSREALSLIITRSVSHPEPLF